MSVPNTLSFQLKPEKSVERRSQRRGAKDSGAWTGCPRRLSSFRACPHPTGSSRLIDSAGSNLAGTARTECAQSLSSVLLTSARQGSDHKEGKYLGFKRKVKRYSDKLTSDKIIFLNYHQTFFFRTQEKPASAGGYSPSFSNSQIDGVPPWDSIGESVTLLLQVLWISVSVNVG